MKEQFELNEYEIEEMIIELLNRDLEDEGLATSFEEAGLCTPDNGVLLKIGKREFQITIVRSK